MANYSTDIDLRELRAGIMDLGVDDWTWAHTRAKEIIDRIIEQRWYRVEAGEQGVLFEDTPFDADNLRAAQIKYLSCYKALELIYQSLMKPGPEPDGYARLMEHFKSRFDDELQSILALGLDYDWDESGTIDEDERIIMKKRRLRRA